MILLIVRNAKILQELNKSNVSDVIPIDIDNLIILLALLPVYLTNIEIHEFIRLIMIINVLNVQQNIQVVKYVEILHQE